MAEHKVLMLWTRKGESAMMRVEKLTIIFIITLLELFAIGLFLDYDENSDQEYNEVDETEMESISRTSWRSIWIMIYTLAIVFPVPFGLKLLFSRTKIQDKDEENVEYQKKKEKIYRIIAWVVCFLTAAYCTWCITLFSN